MEALPLNREICSYPVKAGEVVLIALGALVLAASGLGGIWYKALKNAYTPQRAEAIARSIVEYQFPGAASGVFGLNLGGSRFAEVQSTQMPPDVILLVGVTTDPYAGSQMVSFAEDPNLPFRTTASRTLLKHFCGVKVPVLIEEGTQVLSNGSVLPAVRYGAHVTQGNVERWVQLTTNGSGFLEKAEQVFTTLKCK